MTSGCSDALRIAMDCLGSEKRNILLPKPGFSLYQTIAGNRGIPVKFYDLDVGIYIVVSCPYIWVWCVLNLKLSLSLLNIYPFSASNCFVIDE